MKRGIIFQSVPNVTTSTALHFNDTPPVEIQKDIARFGYLDPFTFSAWIRPESEKSGLFSQSIGAPASDPPASQLRSPARLLTLDVTPAILFHW